MPVGGNVSTVADRTGSGSRQGVLTVLLQDYFHRGVFRTVVGEKQWSRFQSRLEGDVEHTLRLLDEYGVKATFFTLGWIADKFPGLVRCLAEQGHEIASAGYWARSVSEMGPEQFREDARRAKTALQCAAQEEVVGYRCAYRYIRPPESWALSILAAEGYRYDASCCPAIAGRDPWHLRRGARPIATTSGEIWEFPISTTSFIGLNLPISGGNYLRQLPERLMVRAFKAWVRNHQGPFVLYFHPWELNDEQPVITAIGPIARMRQYRNLGKLRTLLPDYFREVPFGAIRDHMGIAPRSITAPGSSGPGLSVKSAQPHDPQHFRIRSVPLSVVIPCFNEESSLPYLESALGELEAAGRSRYDLRFVFVDDCSTDRTLEELRCRFGSRSNCRVEHHESNAGIAKAIQTGLRAAETEIVCSMDADCSYDPLELLRMVEELDADTDMVTASPYHPEGFVLGVPGWRLFLSRSLSRMYHLLLRHKLHTYTSCFRVYRKSAVEGISTRCSDFRGIVELLARLDIQGGRIKEFPTTLQSRIFGYSKMKTLKTVLGHLRLLCGIVGIKLRSRKDSARA